MRPATSDAYPASLSEALMAEAKKK